MTTTSSTIPASGARPFGALQTYLRPQAGRVALLAVALLASTALQLAAPQLVRRFIDGVANLPLRALWGLALLFLAVTLAGQATRVGAAYLSGLIGWAATNRLRHDLADHCLRLDLGFHDAHPPGEMIERLDGDVAALAGFFSEFTVQILGGGLLIAGVVALLFAQDWRVGAAVGGLAIAAIVVLHASRNLSVASVTLERESRTELAGFVEERVGGLDDIRGNGGGAHTMRQLGDITAVLNARSLRAGLVGRAIWVLTAGVFAASSLTALSLGVFLFERGLASIGAVYLFVQYAAMTRDPLNQIGSQLQDVQRAMASLNRLEALRAAAPSVRDGPGTDWPPGALRLTFEAVDFSYGDGPAVLTGVSLDLPRGQVLGLLGRTGSGKTTLIRLLSRLYEPRSGAIRLDGDDIRRARLAQLRGRIGVVTQDVQLFRASVRDNVTLFDAKIADDRIVAVLEDLGLVPWLARQADGLDTTIATGLGLSAGEAQLLAFARVFLRDPGLVVLDEASSRLDPMTDQLVERAMDKLLGSAHGRSAIIIAHKLATVQRADRILILDAGRVVEAGDRAVLAADPASRLSRLLATASQGMLP